MPSRRPTTIADLLRRQDNVVTREQAVAAGLSREHISGHLRTGRWRRLLPQTYLIGAETPSDRQVIRAAWLWAGRDAVLVGRAALFWQRRLAHPPARIEINISPRQRLDDRTTTDHQIVVHRRVIDEDDTVSWDGIVTVRTPIAVHELLADHDGPDILDRSIQQGWVSLTDMVDVQARAFGGRRTRQAGMVLRAAASGGHSAAERLLHRILAGAGLTGWTPHYEVWCGSRRREIDVAFVDVRLAIEIDGFAFHSDPDVFVDDRTRHNQLVAEGWTVLRFTWRHLTASPDAVIAEIRQVLAGLRQRTR